MTDMYGVEYSTDSFGFGAGPAVIVNVHPETQCAGRVCVIHNQTDHHMRDWQMLWRDDRKLFERICPHGIGHPDPDQNAYWTETDQQYQGVHGCDGCCQVSEP